jgi:hypothetical protein
VQYAGLTGSRKLLLVQAGNRPCCQQEIAFAQFSRRRMRVKVHGSSKGLSNPSVTS